MTTMQGRKKPVFGISNGYAPAAGPKGLAMTLPFSTLSTASFDFDFKEVSANGHFDTCQAVWVDNADNVSNVVLTFSPTGQRIIVPANAQVLRPVICADPLTCNAQTLGNVDVSVIFLNVPMPWG